MYFFLEITILFLKILTACEIRTPSFSSFLFKVPNSTAKLKYNIQSLLREAFESTIVHYVVQTR